MAGKGTPATAAAQRAKVVHTLHEYTHDPANRAYGLEAVEALGLDPRLRPENLAPGDYVRVCEALSRACAR